MSNSIRHLKRGIICEQNNTWLCTCGAVLWESMSPAPAWLKMKPWAFSSREGSKPRAQVLPTTPNKPCGQPEVCCSPYSSWLLQTWEHVSRQAGTFFSHSISQASQMFCSSFNDTEISYCKSMTVLSRSWKFYSDKLILPLAGSQRNCLSKNYLHEKGFAISSPLNS